jgi:hypothetical protein
MYGSVRTVVWQGSVGDRRRPYADQTCFEDLGVVDCIVETLGSMVLWSGSSLVATIVPWSFQRGFLVS